jgi:hypothetical protein
MEYHPNSPLRLTAPEMAYLEKLLENTLTKALSLQLYVTDGYEFGQTNYADGHFFEERPLVVGLGALYQRFSDDCCQLNPYTNQQPKDYTILARRRLR